MIAKFKFKLSINTLNGFDTWLVDTIYHGHCGCRGDGGIPVTMGSSSIASPGTLTPVSAHHTPDIGHSFLPKLSPARHTALELETKVLPKVRNHEDGPN